MMTRRLLFRSIMLAGLTLSITAISLVPNPPLPQSSALPLDKAGHGAAYAAWGFAALAWLNGFSGPGRRLRSRTAGLKAGLVKPAAVAAGALILGGGLELLQGLGSRTPEWADLAADLLGAALGGLFYARIRRRYFAARFPFRSRSRLQAAVCARMGSLFFE